MEGMIGEVRMFGGNFAPRNWALCQGQLLSIAQNSALFSIIGTIYGGDGRTTMALPDLRGRAPIGPRSGPGLTTFREGQRGGTPEVTLNQLNLPSHTHPLNVSTGNGNQPNPAGQVFASPQVEVERGAPAKPVNAYAATGNVNSASNVIANAGNGTPVFLQNPVLAVNYIICLFGIFPSRS